MLVRALFSVIYRPHDYPLPLAEEPDITRHYSPILNRPLVSIHRMNHRHHHLNQQ